MLVPGMGTSRVSWCAVMGPSSTRLPAFSVAPTLQGQWERVALRGVGTCMVVVRAGREQGGSGPGWWAGCGCLWVRQARQHPQSCPWLVRWPGSMAGKRRAQGRLSQPRAPSGAVRSQQRRPLGAAPDGVLGSGGGGEGGGRDGARAAVVPKVACQRVGGHTMVWGGHAGRLISHPWQQPNQGSHG